MVSLIVTVVVSCTVTVTVLVLVTVLVHAARKRVTTRARDKNCFIIWFKVIFQK